MSGWQQWLLFQASLVLAWIGWMLSLLVHVEFELTLFYCAKGWWRPRWGRVWGSHVFGRERHHKYATGWFSTGPFSVTAYWHGKPMSASEHARRAKSYKSKREEELTSWLAWLVHKLFSADVRLVIVKLTFWPDSMIDREWNRWPRWRRSGDVEGCNHSGYIKYGPLWVDVIWGRKS